MQLSFRYRWFQAGQASRVLQSDYLPCPVALLLLFATGTVRYCDATFSYGYLSSLYEFRRFPQERVHILNPPGTHFLNFLGCIPVGVQ
jgi:hypothetical protein